MQQASPSDPVDGGALGPTLTRGDDWVGNLPGLGTVTVNSSGEIAVRASVRPLEDPDSLAQRETALRQGWGEPLSFVRRGFALAAGAAVSHPGSAQAILLVGDPHLTAPIVAQLCALGWTLVSDRPSPLLWAGASLVAHPRSAPLLMSGSQAMTCQLPALTLRGDTDVVAVDVPRADSPCRVAAAVAVREGGPGRVAFHALSGLAKFEFVATMTLRGPLVPPEHDPDLRARAEADLAEKVRLSALPAAEWRLPPGTVDLTAMLGWWAEVADL